jgi:hypothetical protein
VAGGIEYTSTCPGSATGPGVCDGVGAPEAESEPSECSDVESGGTGDVLDSDDWRVTTRDALLFSLARLTYSVRASSDNERQILFTCFCLSTKSGRRKKTTVEHMIRLVFETKLQIVKLGFLIFGQRFPVKDL